MGIAGKHILLKMILCSGQEWVDCSTYVRIVISSTFKTSKYLIPASFIDLFVEIARLS